MCPISSGISDALDLVKGNTVWNPFRKRSSVQTPDAPSAYDIVRDAVQAHADRGEPAYIVRRAFLDWCGDSARADVIRAVEEVYGLTS